MSASPVRVALVGMGRMGRALDALAPERGCTVVARLDAADVAGGIRREQLAGADVAIEFTAPDAAVPNALGCLAAGVPVVIGTTGWGARLPEVAEAAARHGGRVLWSPNFSLGVQLFLALAEEAARRMCTGAGPEAGFDCHVVETHHAAKRDAPSGTALAVAERLAAGGWPGVPVTSVRTGSVPGTHEILFDAPFEQIRLVHEARDRRVFADGALAAARWLAQPRMSGVYTMRDLLADGALRPGTLEE